jgi:ligand-binding SRPBCC domain-containing protein
METVGMIGLGQTASFEGKHFGFRQRLTVKVVEFDRPRLFVDEMTEGAFASFLHVHEFSPHDGGTLMRDTLVWRPPFGAAGWIVDKLLLKHHLRNLVSTRNARLKQIAEAV